jgi:hypothetical protein
LLGIAKTSIMTVIKTMEEAKVVGVEDWLGNFYPLRKILLFIFIRVC